MQRKSDAARDIDVSDSRRFVRELLELSGRDDLRSLLDEEQLTGPLFQAVADLTLVAGGKIMAEGSPAPADPAKLGVLIGSHYHLNMTEAVWQSLIIAVPLLVDLLQSGDLVKAAGSILGIFGVVRNNLQKIEPGAAQLYLAVKALEKRNLRTTAKDVIQFLNARSSVGKEWKLDEIDRLLGRMVRANVLTERPDGFHCIT